MMYAESKSFGGALGIVNLSIATGAHASVGDPVKRRRADASARKV
jgi:hypothetical protein